MVSSLAEQVLPHACIFAETYGIPVELLLVNDPDIGTLFWPPLPGGEYLQRIAPGFTAIASGRLRRGVGKSAAVIVERAKSDPRLYHCHGVASRVAHITTNPLASGIISASI